MKAASARSSLRFARAPLATCVALAFATLADPAFSAVRHSATGHYDRPVSHDAATIAHPASLLAVTSCADDGGVETLRTVIGSAATGDTIDLTTLTCSTITLTQGAIITSLDDLSLIGPASSVVTIDGGGTDSVLIGYGAGTLSIDHLAIAHGRYDGSGSYANGGCVFSNGNITLSTVTLSSCSVGSAGVSGYGGGVFAYGNLSIASSTISGNYSEQNGAGAFAFGNISVSDSTVSGNSVPSVGGGLFGVGGLSVHNSTIAFNTGNYGGGGIYLASSATPDIRSSIIANNVATRPGFAAADIGSPYSTAISGSNNLIVSSDLPVPGDTLTSDPQLLALANNGGATQTQALGIGSPAVDAGSNDDGLAFDQRGPDFERTVGAAVDIGAFEVQATSDFIFSDGFDGVPPH